MAGASDRVRLLHVVRGRAAFPPEIDLSTLAEDGNGVTFSTTIGLTELAGPAGDFNGDGRQDIFFAGAGCLGEGAVLVLYGGPEMFRQEGVVTLGPDQVHDVGGLLVSGPGLFSGLDPWATIPGDLDGDGHVDLFLRQSNSAGCTLSPASGAGFVFDREAVLRDGLDPERFPFIAALYGDTDVGYPDMVVSWAERQEGVLRMQGGLVGYDLGVLAAPAGDFNGDGYLDLAIGSAAGPVSVLFGSADLESLDLEIPDLSGRTITIQTAAEHCAGGFDWDKDGIGDIALASADATFRIVFGALRVGGQFIRGDADGSGYLNLSDPIVILGYLFLGNAPLGCLDAGDADDDGVLILTDAIYVLSYLFLGGPAPSSPFTDPGLDPTDDLLSCGVRGL
jgi:hypothetical protein